MTRKAFKTTAHNGSPQYIVTLITKKRQSDLSAHLFKDYYIIKCTAKDNSVPYNNKRNDCTLCNL